MPIIIENRKNYLKTNLKKENNNYDMPLFIHNIGKI